MSRSFALGTGFPEPWPSKTAGPWPFSAKAPRCTYSTGAKLAGRRRLWLAKRLCGNSARQWIIRNQLARRNITTFARVELEEKLAELLREAGKENQKVGGKTAGRGRPKKGLAIVPKPIDTRAAVAKLVTMKRGDNQYTEDAQQCATSQAEVGKLANVSRETVRAFEYCEAHGTPEQLQDLRTNPDAKIHRVAKQLREAEGRDVDAKAKPICRNGPLP